MTLPKLTPVQEVAMIDACAYGVVLTDSVKAVTVKALLGKGLIELISNGEDLESFYAPTELGYKVCGATPPISQVLAKVEASVSADEAEMMEEPVEKAFFVNRSARRELRRSRKTNNRRMARLLDKKNSVWGNSSRSLSAA